MSWEVTRTVYKPRNVFIEIGIVFGVVFLVIVFGLFFVSYLLLVWVCDEGVSPLLSI